MWCRMMTRCVFKFWPLLQTVVAGHVAVLLAIAALPTGASISTPRSLVVAVNAWCGASRMVTHSVHPARGCVEITTTALSWGCWHIAWPRLKHAIQVWLWCTIAILVWTNRGLLRRACINAQLDRTLLVLSILIGIRLLLVRAIS